MLTPSRVLGSLSWLFVHLLARQKAADHKATTGSLRTTQGQSRQDKGGEQRTSEAPLPEAYRPLAVTPVCACGAAGNSYVRLFRPPDSCPLFLLQHSMPVHRAFTCVTPSG